MTGRCQPGFVPVKVLVKSASLVHEVVFVCFVFFQKNKI